MAQVVQYNRLTLYTYTTVVQIRMLDGQEGRCAANRCIGSVVPSKDLSYSPA